MIKKLTGLLLPCSFLLCSGAYATNVCPSPGYGPNYASYPKSILPCDFVRGSVGMIIIQNDAKSMHFKIHNYGHKTVPVYFEYYSGCKDSNDYPKYQLITVKVDPNDSKDINYTTLCTYARVKQYWPQSNSYGVVNIGAGIPELNRVGVSP